MSYDIKVFQKRHSLTNKDMADICGCSIPTIQKWRSGEVAVSGAATNLMRLLDLQSEGNPLRLREILGRLNSQVQSLPTVGEEEIKALHTNMHKVVNRLEVMLENRRRDRELADSEARYRSMVESGSEPVCRWLPDTTLTFVNEAYANVYSSSAERLIGRRWLELIPESRRKSIEALVSDMVRRGQAETMVHESIDRDGQLRVQEWRDFPVKDSTGQVVEFHSVGRDVTDLFALRKQADELARTKAGLMTLSPQPVFIFDQQGAILEANAAFEREMRRGQAIGNLSGLMPGTAVGMLKRLLKRVSGPDEICYRVRHGEDSLMLKISALTPAEEEQRRYIALVTGAVAVDNPVLSVRLRHEIVLDGERHGFLMDPAIAARVRRRMEELAQQAVVDRIYVFTVDMEEGLFSNVLEWCADGVPSHLDDLQNIPSAEYPWWINRIGKGQWIQIQDTRQLPRSAVREREILEAQGICSALVAPLMVAGKAVGFVGFDQNNTPRVWHDQERKALELMKSEMESLLARTLAGKTR